MILIIDTPQSKLMWILAARMMQPPTLCYRSPARTSAEFSLPQILKCWHVLGSRTYLLRSNELKSVFKALGTHKVLLTKRLIDKTRYLIQLSKFIKCIIAIFNTKRQYVCFPADGLYKG